MKFARLALFILFSFVGVAAPDPTPATTSGPSPATKSAPAARPATTTPAPAPVKNEPAEIAALRPKAERGNGIAQYNLGLAYVQGRGIRADPAEAFVWLTLASEGGSTGKALDTLLSTINTDQLADGRRRLETLRTTNPYLRPPLRVPARPRLRPNRKPFATCRPRCPPLTRRATLFPPPRNPSASTIS